MRTLEIVSKYKRKDAVRYEKGNKTSFKKWKKKWKRRFRIMKLFKSHIGKILPIILLIVCRKLLRELNKWQIV